MSRPDGPVETGSKKEETEAKQMKGSYVEQDTQRTLSEGRSGQEGREAWF